MKVIWGSETENPSTMGTGERGERKKVVWGGGGRREGKEGGGRERRSDSFENKFRALVIHAPSSKHNRLGTGEVRRIFATLLPRRTSLNISLNTCSHTPTHPPHPGRPARAA